MTKGNFTCFALVLTAEFWASWCPHSARGGPDTQKGPTPKSSQLDDGQTATGCAPLCAAAAPLTLMNGECAPPCHAHGCCHGQQPDGRPGEDDGGRDGGDGTDDIATAVMALLTLMNRNMCCLAMQMAFMAMLENVHHRQC